jgi:hypothetical protein
VADLCAAEASREVAVTGATLEDQARAWRRWECYCVSIGITDDVYLDGLDRHERIKLMGAFAMALRERRFSRPADAPLAEKTVRNTVSYVAQAFRENDRSNPTRDDDGLLGRLLSRLYRSFKNRDPAEKQQKALPVCVLVELAKLGDTETQRALYQLAIGAFFFAMRSCEYLKVKQAEKQRTDILRLRNIRFFKKGTLLSHNNKSISTADNVSITFEFQKKDERDDTVTQH